MLGSPTRLSALLPDLRRICLSGAPASAVSTAHIHLVTLVSSARETQHAGPTAVPKMDPLTAFGLAANVVSFVSFASDLVKTSVDVYRAGADATGDVLSMERVYGDLSCLSRRLGLTCQQRISHDNARPWVPSFDEVEVETAVLAVKGLAELCKKDCDELLRITDKLRLKMDGDARSKRESFRIAIKKLRKEGDIEKIEGRLHQRQATLTLHVCTISGYYPHFIHPRGPNVSGLGSLSWDGTNSLVATITRSNLNCKARVWSCRLTRTKDSEGSRTPWPAVRRCSQSSTMTRTPSWSSPAITS